MFEIRHILVRMRQGESDRAIAKAGLIGRPKAKALRLVAKDRNWLDQASPLPDDAVLAQVLGATPAGFLMEDTFMFEFKSAEDLSKPSPDDPAFPMRRGPGQTPHHRLHRRRFIPGICR